MITLPETYNDKAPMNAKTYLKMKQQQKAIKSYYSGLIWCAGMGLVSLMLTVLSVI